MKSGQGQVTWGRQLPAADPVFRDSVLRVTTADAHTFGFVLARLRAERRQSLTAQADSLHVSESALVFLSVFRVPRPDRCEQDLAATADATGVAVKVLRELLAAGTHGTDRPHRVEGGRTNSPD